MFVFCSGVNPSSMIPIERQIVFGALAIMDARKVGGLLLTVVSSVASGVAPALLKTASRTETDICTGVLLATTLVGVALIFLSSRPSGTPRRRSDGGISRAEGQGVSVQGEGNTVHVTHAGNSNTASYAKARPVLHVAITPETIEKLFDDYTAIQARHLAKVYDGKLMRVAGSIQDMRELDRGGGVSLDLKRADGLRVIHCCFSSKKTEVLEALPKGHRVVIVGAIDLSNALMTLTNCELESVVA